MGNEAKEDITMKDLHYHPQETKMTTNSEYKTTLLSLIEQKVKFYDTIVI